MTNTLTLDTPSEREIAMVRAFDAPRTLVFEALTKPELVKRWLLGPPGWTMPVCEIDLRVGGTYREIARPARLIHTENFDTAWYPGEAVITTVLAEQAGKTTMTATILYESREARHSVLKSGMERGVAASYDRLEALVAQGRINAST